MFVQYHPNSTWQLASQPSKAERLPSSHCSSPSATPLPQTAGSVVVVVVVSVVVVVDCEEVVDDVVDAVVLVDSSVEVVVDAVVLVDDAVDVVVDSVVLVDGSVEVVVDSVVLVDGSVEVVVDAVVLVDDAVDVVVDWVVVVVDVVSVVVVVELVVVTVVEVVVVVVLVVLVVVEALVVVGPGQAPSRGRHSRRYRSTSVCGLTPLAARAVAPIRSLPAALLLRSARAATTCSVSVPQAGPVRVVGGGSASLVIFRLRRFAGARHPAMSVRLTHTWTRNVHESLHRPSRSQVGSPSVQVAVLRSLAMSVPSTKSAT